MPVPQPRRLTEAAGAGEVYRFVLTTGLSASITLGGPIVLHEFFEVGEEVAVGIALFIAFCVNFLTIRNFVFQAGGMILPQLIRFAAVSLAFRSGEYLGFLFLHILFDIFYVLAVGITLVVSFALKFVCYRVFVFKIEGRLP